MASLVASDTALDVVASAFDRSPEAGAWALKTLCSQLKREMAVASALIESIDDALEASSDFLDGGSFRGETLVIHVHDLRRHLDDLRACLAVYA